MSQRQQLNLKIKGLYTSPNNLSAVPEGALQIADNVVINSNDVAESRRGQKKYGSELDIGSGQVNKLFNYASSLIASYDDKLAYDNSGTWVEYSGTYEGPDADTKIRSLESNQNFYFTTNEGIKKLDQLSGTPVMAGAPRALGGSYSLAGGSGFLEGDSAVAYRLLWGYEDANNNLILGAPSARLIAINDLGPGMDRDVALTFLIPDSVTTNYFYQIYRSFATEDATITPSDELQLVLQASPTSGEISAGTFTVTDSTPFSLMRAALYTNPSQEGIQNSNFQPPFAVDLCSYKNSAIYANVKQKQLLSVALLGVETPSFGYITTNVNTHTGTAVLDGIASTTGVSVGMRVIATGVPVNTTVVSIDSAVRVTVSNNSTATATVSAEFQDRFTLSNVNYYGGSSQNVGTNQFEVETGGTPGTNINFTAINLVELINKSVSNTELYAYYTSGLEDTPGQMLFEERGIGGDTFYATSSNGLTSFSPPLPVSGQTVASSNEVKQNQIFVSKPQQPEAVPIYRNFFIGSANFPILRAIALRDAVFFFKKDGIFILTGQTFESFVINLLDSTVTLSVPESAQAFNNQVFFFSTQGICSCTETGVQLMSVPIENTLLTLSSEDYPYFIPASFGVAYESARLYMFFTVTNTDDQHATQAFVFNSLTQSWTRWELMRTCGIVGQAVDKLFMGETDSGVIKIERKNYTEEDYADDEFDVNITSIDSSTQITIDVNTEIFAGMTLQQDGVNYIIETVTDFITLTFADTNGLATGVATCFTPIENKIEWVPLTAANPGVLKQFSEISLFFKNATFAEIEAGFNTNINSTVTIVDLINNNNSGGWGDLSWGDFPWGGGFIGRATLRTYVPPNSQRANWLTLYLKTNQAFTGFSLEGISILFNAMSSRIK